MSHNSLPHHFLFFFFNDTATTEIYTLSLHDALPISTAGMRPSASGTVKIAGNKDGTITAFTIDCHGTPGYTGGATVNLGLLPYIYLEAIPNWKRTHSVAFTNAGGARAMRAPGHPQNCVLTEFA